MLLLKSPDAFRDIFNASTAPLVILPASEPDVQDAANVQRANDLAVAARIDGFGVTVPEGNWAWSGIRELFVVVVGNEAQVVGFARRVIEAEAAADWFLFRCPGGDLVRENRNRSREACMVTNDSFTLADGRIFHFGAAYTPASFNTGWAHWTGAEVGEYLRAV